MASSSGRQGRRREGRRRCGHASCSVSGPSAGPRSPRRRRSGRTRRARRINRELPELYPYAHSELDFENPFQLLVATVLSAQTTDLRVNQTTPALFARYPTRRAGRGRPPSVEEILQPTGFFRAKATSIHGPRRRAASDSAARCPARLEDLVTLPGVGRKTANVVLGNAFGVPGITVDTHFGRLSRRFGWTAEDHPVKVEQEVGALFPKRDWTMLSHRPDLPRPPHLPRPQPACGACPMAACARRTARARPTP